MQMNKTWQIRT